MRVTRDGHAVAVAGTVARLVALVALRGASPRSAVAATLWPETRDVRAQANLRTALWRVHRAAPGLLETTADEVGPAAEVEVDVALLIAAARRLAARSGGVAPDPPLPAGELLPGWFEDWVLLERDRVRQWRLHALEALAAHQAAAGRHAEALATAYDAIGLEPLRESAHRVLIGVHLAEGNVVEARRHFGALRSLLLAELSVEPTPTLRAMMALSPGTDPGELGDAGSTGPARSPTVPSAQKVASR